MTRLNVWNAKKLVLKHSPAVRRAKTARPPLAHTKKSAILDIVMSFLALRLRKFHTAPIYILHNALYIALNTDVTYDSSHSLQQCELWVYYCHISILNNIVAHWAIETAAGSADVCKQWVMRPQYTGVTENNILAKKHTAYTQNINIFGTIVYI